MVTNSPLVNLERDTPKGLHRLRAHLEVTLQILQLNDDFLIVLCHSLIFFVGHRHPGWFVLLCYYCFLSDAA